MYNLGHLCLYKNIPIKRRVYPIPDYVNDTYEVLQYKSHLRNEFLIPLKANGDGSGVATIRLQSLETQSVKITGNGKFYTSAAGTTELGIESTIGTTLGSLYVKVPAGDSCYLVCGKADKLSGLGDVDTNVIADGANIPYINYCAINYPLINLSVIRLLGVLNSSFTGSIDNTPNLTYINFSNNLLTAFTGSIDNTPNLINLYFSNNLLTAFTGSIDSTPNLENLYFTNNLLTAFTGSIDNTPNIRNLSFSNNLLSAFTGSIDNTPNLITLYFSNNLLTAFTGSIDNTPNLTYIDFSNNLLTAFTGSIDNTPNIRTLSFTNNLLTAFTGSIDNTPNLENLSFTNNLLTAFTGSIDNTPNIRTLSFTNNLLTSLTGDIGKAVKCVFWRSHINANCTFTYVTRRSDWTSAYNTLWVSCSSMTSAMVDNLLIDLDNSGVMPTGTGLINLNGLCGAVTSASAAARTSLVNKGFTVIVNT